MGQLGEIPLQVVDHPLEQEVAEGHAAQADLGIGNGIEDRRIRLAVVENRGVFVKQGLHVVGQVIGQRHLDEDQRLGRHARVEEGVEAAVGIEAVLEVGPGTDFMHRFVFDQFFEQRSRRMPGNTLQFEETDVEPGAQARLQFAVEHGQFLVLLQIAQQVGAQIDQELDALRDGVELGQDADARRAHGAAQRGFGLPLVGRADRLLVGGMGLFDLLRVGAEFQGDQLQEALAPLVVQAQIGFRQPRRPAARRHLAAQAFRTLAQLAAQLLDTLGRQRDALGVAAHQRPQFMNQISCHHELASFQPLCIKKRGWRTAPRRSIRRNSTTPA